MPSDSNFFLLPTVPTHVMHPFGTRHVLRCHLQSGTRRGGPA
jgi:hypothetical protein